MRIHLVTDQFNLGGGIEHIYQIVSGLNQFHFVIFGEAGKGDALYKFKNLSNVEIHSTGYSPDVLLKHKPDLIHFHHLKPFVSFFANSFFRRSLSVPVLYTAHGLHLHKYEFMPGLSSRIKYLLRFNLEKYVLRKASRVIAVSEEDKTFLENQYGLKKVVYITNGINSQAVTRSAGLKSKSELRQALHLPIDCFLFVTVARFNFQKGYDILLKGISKTCDILNRYQCQFLLVGDGEELEPMRTMATRMGIDSFIQFMGARTDVYDIMAASDAFLLPSRWEGLPIVLLEAGLLKIPVIASDTYGNREILSHNRGILFKNLDPMALSETITHTLNHSYDLKTCADRLFSEIWNQYSLDSMLTYLNKVYQSFREP